MAYAHLDSRKRLAILLEEQIDWISFKRDLKLKQFQTVRTIAARRLGVISSVQQLSIERLLSLVEKELDKIQVELDQTQQKQGDHEGKEDQANSGRLYSCPNCKCHFACRPTSTATTVICPNKACSQRVIVPAFEKGTRSAEDHTE
jgi:hypothetical protein